MNACWSTTLTKRMAEDLSEHYTEAGVKCAYLHSEVSTLDRVKILRDLRRGTFDALIGINLLREGLDLPRGVAGRDSRRRQGRLPRDLRGSLIQTMGRAARNLNGRAILYGDVMTASMKQAIDETNRRRATQVAYNDANGITPESIIKPIDGNLIAITDADYMTVPLEEDELPDASSRRNVCRITLKRSRRRCARRRGSSTLNRRRCIVTACRNSRTSGS